MASQGARNARVVELTEFISVRTIVMTATQVANDSELTFLHDKVPQPILENISNSGTPTLIKNNMKNKNFPQLITPLNIQTKLDFCCQVAPELKDSAVNTSKSSPQCDVCLKSSCKTDHKSLAIQCALSDENDDDCTDIVTLEINNIITPNFEDFTKKNYFTYPHDIYECLICGEISKGSEEINNHMTIHWDPNELCSKCGRIFDSALLYARHNCSKIRRSTSLLCTHSLCPVVKTSLKNKHQRRCCIRDPYERFKNKRLIKRIFHFKRINKSTYKYKNN